MKRTTLLAAAAVAPLFVALSVGEAAAETQITAAQATPVSTSTANKGAPDDVTITAAGSITPTAPGAAVTLDSSNKVLNQGVITFNDVDNATGILVDASKNPTGSITNTGSISVTSSYVATDSNADGLLDGAFAQGTGRYGIKVTGAGTMTGDILMAGSMAVQGNNSVGISIGAPVTGSLSMQQVTVSGTTTTLVPGTITLTGDNTVGLQITPTGSLGGDLKIVGVSATGVNAKGVDIEGPVAGKVNVIGGVTATGYRSTTRSPVLAALKIYTADELQQGGPALTVGANVGKGIIISAPPTTLSTDVPDQDGDGIPDAQQTTGSVTSFGSAPAILIGNPGGDVTIGPFGTGTQGYGLIIQGSVAADGVYDPVTSPNLPAPVPATAIQFGVVKGGAVTVAGGVHNTGTISANAYEAEAFAIHIQPGVTFTTDPGTPQPAIANDGTIASASTGSAVTNANGIWIEAGSVVPSISNTGTLTATYRGSAGDANAIVDQSGSVRQVTNTGVITAQVTQTDSTVAVTGFARAIDVSQSTSGVTILQQQSALTGATAPSMTGAILFGTATAANPNVLDVEAGTVTGALAEGDRNLNVKVAGSLQVLNAASHAVTNLEVDKGASLTVTVDPAFAVGSGVAGPNGAGTAIFDTTSTAAGDADGKAVFQSGSTVGLTLSRLQTDQVAKYIIAHTSGAAGSLTVGTLNESLQGNTPFLFGVTASSDAQNLYLTVGRRSAAELGFTKSEASAYDAIFSALLQDSGIQNAILAQTTQVGLVSLYDQLLPDQGVGLFESLDNATEVVSALTGTAPDAGVHAAGTSLWLQEVNNEVRRSNSDILGSRSHMFGMVGGYEHMGAGGGALGVTLAYMNIEEQDSAAAVGEHVVGNVIEGGAYYRRSIGGLTFSARGAGGVVFFKGVRQFIFPGVSREARSSWTGFFADAHAGASYEVGFGRFYVRPEVSADFLNLHEGARNEKDGGDGFDLAVNARTSHRLSGSAIVTFGGQWGRESWFRPEIRGGYREIFSGSEGATVASFTGGSLFTVASPRDRGGWATVGFSLKAGTNLSFVSVDGDADLRKGDQRYDVRLSGRAMF